MSIELPLKRYYCGSDSEGSDNEGTDTKHELGGTVGANGEGSDNEDHTVAFRQSPRTNHTKRKHEEASEQPKEFQSGQPSEFRRLRVRLTTPRDGCG